VAFITGVEPEPTGYVTIDGSGYWRSLTFNADSLDAGKSFLVTVAATDGLDTTYCDIIFEPRLLEHLEVRIETINSAPLGSLQSVDVVMTKGSSELGGFEMLLGYDRTALFFENVSAGALYDECGWEYFTYRFLSYSICPLYSSETIGIYSMADITNASHPSCYQLPKPFVWFTLNFRVTNDTLYECTVIPIRFYWCSCGENILASKYGDSLFFSDTVVDFDGMVIPMSDTFPNFSGPPDECLEDKPSPYISVLRLVNYYNGGIITACPNSVEDIGDLNRNGVAFEIADIIMYVNYFIYGYMIFQIDPQAQVAASDMNQDGVTLDVADLVYGIRRIIGDALPPDSLSGKPPASATFIQDFDERTVSVTESNAVLGAAHLIFEGKILSFLPLQQQMEIMYTYDIDSNVTRCLIYSLEGRSFMPGELVTYSDEAFLVDASVATWKRGLNTAVRLGIRQTIFLMFSFCTRTIPILSIAPPLSDSICRRTVM
jgi:hypothetical protein